MNDTTLTPAPRCPHCSARDLDACHPAASAARAKAGETWVMVRCSSCRRDYQVVAYTVLNYSTRPVTAPTSGKKEKP